MRWSRSGRRCVRVRRRRRVLSEVTSGVLADARELYASAYFGSTMHDNLSRDVAGFAARPGSAPADVFRLFLDSDELRGWLIVAAVHHAGTSANRSDPEAHRRLQAMLRKHG